MPLIAGQGETPSTPKTGRASLTGERRTHMAKGGRPRVKSRQINFRISEADFETVSRKAEQSNLTISEFFRRSALGKKVPRGVPALNRKAWLQLAPLGNLVNQIAMKIHMGEVEALTEEMEEILMETREQIKMLRDELREGPNGEIEP